MKKFEFETELCFKHKMTIFLLLFSLLFSAMLYAQDDEMGLEELLAQEINVASQKALSIRETPGIVSVITADEILSMGANDLIDILNIVPGIFLGSDVSGVVSLGMRGIWGNEGKIFLLWDGHEMNELTYSNLVLGGHFCVEQIERIEIIRGPGSAKYGGFAELGVINIITKKEDETDFGAFSMTYGFMNDTYGSRGGNLSLAKVFGDFKIDASLFYKQSIISNRWYYDMYGDSFNMALNSFVNPINANLGFEYKNLEINLMVDKYNMSVRDIYDYILPKSVEQAFDYYFADMKYTLKIGNKIQIIPSLKYKLQYPWKITDRDTTVIENYWHLKSDKVLENITFNYEHSKDFTFTFGEEFYYERCMTGDTFQVLFANDASLLVNQNGSLFSEMIYNIPKIEALFTLGGRFEYNAKYGYFFVPRAGLTKTFSKTHFKFLFSDAFRSPSFMNVDGNDNIEPERTRSIEFEAGYMISPELYVVGNIYDISINFPIVYYFDEETFIEGYINEERVGTRGGEIDLKAKYNKISCSVGYSYYTANDNQVDLYAIPSIDWMLLAAPSHKVSGFAAYNINSNLSFALNAEYITKRYGYYLYDEMLEDFISKEFPPVYLINANINYKNLFVEGLSLGLFAKNVLDDDYVYLQPYNGAFAPLPANDREIGVKLSYKFNL